MNVKCHLQDDGRRIFNLKYFCALENNIWHWKIIYIDCLQLHNIKADVRRTFWWGTDIIFSSNSTRFVLNNQYILCLISSDDDLT